LFISLFKKKNVDKNCLCCCCENGEEHTEEKAARGVLFVVEALGEVSVLPDGEFVVAKEFLVIFLFFWCHCFFPLKVTVVCL